jgi:hypothetical protein
MTHPISSFGLPIQQPPPWKFGGRVKSASALPLPLNMGNVFIVESGPVTTIDSFAPTTYLGPPVLLLFTSAITLNVGAGKIILPGGANIVTEILDAVEFMPQGLNGLWICTNYHRANVVPLDSGAWTAGAAPTITATSGTFTTVSGTIHYRKIGRIVHVRGTVTITAPGTAAQNVFVTLPFQAGTRAGTGIGIETANTGKGVVVYAAAGATTAMLHYSGDATSIIAAGANIEWSMTYESQL